MLHWERFLFMISQFIKYFSIKCHYQKGICVYQEQDLCDRIGLIHSGKVDLIHYTINGDERVLATLHEFDLFGDFLINSPNPFYPGDLVTKEETVISYLDKEKLNQILSKDIKFQKFFISQLSIKALKLNQHNKILMQSTLREKILMWLLYERINQKTNQIKIPKKETLANYFNVARPSLSRELIQMKNAKLIDYDRHYIYLKEVI